jgi:GNAT superfamily N-acetyltransferase
MIRQAIPTDTDALIALAADTGIFRPGEAEELLGGVLTEFHAGRLGSGHQVWVSVAGPDGPPVGWVYFAPAAKADGVWDLWWIGVAPGRQKSGTGGELLAFVEDQVRTAGARVLVIETSSAPSFAPVRQFYLNRGYSDCGTIPDFYADGDGKVTFAKRMTLPAAN